MYYQTAHDDAFVISSTTALGMGEHLLSLLDTLIQNLPESELREMRRGLNQSRALVDGLLSNIALSSPFDALTVSDGMCILSSFSDSYLLRLNKFPPPSVSTTLSASQQVPTPLAGLLLEFLLCDLNLHFFFYYSLPLV
jgi:hypothetical protein